VMITTRFGMSIYNRVVIITGATGGLGKVAAKQFAEQGARLALVSTSAEKLGQLSKDLNLPEDRILTFAADLSLPASAREISKAVLAKFGRIEIWLHLVGGWSGGKEVIDVDGQQVSSMLQQHLWTTFHLAQAFLPAMVSNHWGRILVISSPSASRPGAKSGPYAIGKAAQEALMLTIAQEVKDSGITANMLLVKTIDVNHERDHTPDVKNVSWTTPEEIAATLLHLSSDEAQMINGARIPLYGNS